MPTPEVTGSAALQSKEIKKIAREYAEYCCPESSYDGDIVERNMDLRICADEVALPVLEWLSNDYCIVPKSKLKEIYDCYKQHGQVTDKKGLHDAMLIARGSIATMHDIFGQELFEEEKK